VHELTDGLKNGGHNENQENTTNNISDSKFKPFNAPISDVDYFDTIPTVRTQ
jgi:hypothetical protein